MVEVNQRIPDRDEAKLRPAAQAGEPSAASRVFDERPLRGAPLTSLPAREATGVRGTAQKRLKRDEKTLDDAADVIHVNWKSAYSSINFSLSFFVFLYVVAIRMNVCLFPTAKSNLVRTFSGSRFQKRGIDPLPSRSASKPLGLLGTAAP